MFHYVYSSMENKWGGYLYETFETQHARLSS